MYIDNLTVEITDKCNARCPQCMRTNPNGCVPNTFVRNIDMTIDNFKCYVPYTILKNIKKISFNCPMGDPVAHANIFPILDYIVLHNPDIKIDFPTNGSLRNQDYWQRLATYKQVTATFAIDGIHNSTHTHYRRNTNLSKILNNATTYINAGGNAVWQFIIFEHNHTEESQAKQTSIDLGFSNFVSFHSSRFNNTDTFKYSYENINYELNLVDTDLKYRSKLHYGQRNHVNSIKCNSLYNKEIFIDIEGNIMPCCYHAGSLFANIHINKRDSFNNYIDVSFDNYNIEKFNINTEGFESAFNSYEKYMEDLKEQWRVMNPPLCKIVCGKCD